MRTRKILYITSKLTENERLRRTEHYANRMTLKALLNRCGENQLDVAEDAHLDEHNTLYDDNFLKQYDFFICEYLPYYNDPPDWDFDDIHLPIHKLSRLDYTHKHVIRPARDVAYALFLTKSRVLLLGDKIERIIEGIYDRESELSVSLPSKEHMHNYFEKRKYTYDEGYETYDAFRQFAVAWNVDALPFYIKEFFHSERVISNKVDDAIDVLLKDMTLGELERIALKAKLREEFVARSIENLAVDRHGYTGKGVIKAGNVAIKVDLASRLDKEFKVYLRLEDSDFAPFCSSLAQESQYTKFGDMGFLPLRNLDLELPGFMKSNLKYGHLLTKANLGLFDHYGFSHSLFLMGLFHKAVGGFDSTFKSDIGLAAYADLNGNPHHLTFDQPRVNEKGESYERFSSSAVSDNSFIPVIDYYNSMLAELRKSNELTVIDGDWKPDNLCLGHKVDFGCVGMGLEIDDLAYYLSDSSLGIGLHNFKKYVDQYLMYRSLHDKEFGESIFAKSTRFKFSTIADSAWLRQLILRHAVMNKRDLTDDSKYLERQYYKHRIEEALREGKFI